MLMHGGCGFGFLCIQIPHCRRHKCACRWPKNTDLLKRKRGGGGRNECNVCHPFAEFFFLCACVCSWCLFFRDLHFCVCVMRFSCILRPWSLEIQSTCQPRQSFWTKHSCHLDGLKKKKKAQQNALFRQAVTWSPSSKQPRQCLEKAKRKI